MHVLFASKSLVFSENPQLSVHIDGSYFSILAQNNPISSWPSPFKIITRILHSAGIQTVWDGWESCQSVSCYLVANLFPAQYFFYNWVLLFPKPLCIFTDFFLVKQCCECVTFWYGSGSADPYQWLTDPDPDPAFFVSNLKIQQKNYFFSKFFLPITFVCTFTVHLSSMIKSNKEVTKQ